MGEENSGAFKCVKISLIVIYVLSIILVVVLIALSIIALVVINNYDAINSRSPGEHKLTPEEKALAKNVAIGAIILFAITLVLTIIGLIGIIKENKCIVITITVFSVIGVVAHIAKGDIISAIISLAITVLTGVYAYMIIKNQKGSNAV